MGNSHACGLKLCRQRVDPCRLAEPAVPQDQGWLGGCSAGDGREGMDLTHTSEGTVEMDQALHARRDECVHGIAGKPGHEPKRLETRGHVCR